MEKEKDYKLTPKQKRFADEYIKNGGNKADAVRKAGYNIKGKGGSNTKQKEAVTATVIGIENIKKPNVKAYLDDKADKAGEKIYQLVESEDNRIALDASKFIYEQVHGKATQKNIIAGDTDNPLRIDILTASTDDLLKMIGRSK